MHPRLKVTMNQAVPRVRSLYIVGGVSGCERTLKINNPDIQTLAAALLERMYYCKVDGKFVEPPCVDSGYLNRTLSSFKNKLLKNVRRPTPISPEQFVEMYRGRKRTLYAANLPEYYDGVMRKHSISAAFVKCEKVPGNKAPRCIQPRHPVYNIGLGVYIKHLEHPIYGAIARVFGDDVTVVKGFNVQQIARIATIKWDSFNDPVAVGLDATKFDMHVSASMLQWEHSIYLAIYDNAFELRRLLDWQVNNRGIGRCDDGKLSYSVYGRRFSGDMNTALGNCIIMCAMVWTYAREKGIDVKLMNNGDDCQVFMERKHLYGFSSGLHDWFLKLGFRMTVEAPAFDLPCVEFCQMRPIRTSRGWTMVRNVTKAREKDSMSIIPLSCPAIAEKWLYAIGECGMALCGGVPIMQSLYRMYMRNGVKSNIQDSVAMNCGARMLAIGLCPTEAIITAQARLDCFTAWGITPDEQVAIERWYDNMLLDLKQPIPVDILQDIYHCPL